MEARFVNALRRMDDDVMLEKVAGKTGGAIECARVEADSIDAVARDSSLREAILPQPAGTSTKYRAL